VTQKKTPPAPDAAHPAVAAYLSARARLACAAGTGKSKRRSAAHYQRITQAAAAARTARAAELVALRAEVERLRSEVKRLRAKVRDR
jgi:polyhydroxyalkanoate synthesis regulator phasin